MCVCGRGGWRCMCGRVGGDVCGRVGGDVCGGVGGDVCVEGWVEMGVCGRLKEELRKLNVCV